MARPSIDTDKRTFLAAIRRKDAIANGALRTELGWTDTRYWRIHSELFVEGKIVKGRGRGGTVARAH
jgi:type I restriction enzyme M protein